MESRRPLAAITITGTGLLASVPSAYDRRVTTPPPPTAVTASNDVRHSWSRDLLLLGLCFVLFFGLWLGTRALWSPDEGRYAEIPREMVESGDFITPRLNGVKYLEKPPLVYWLVAGSIRVFGVNEWALRLVPALFALAGVLLVYATGRRLYGRRAGLLAAIVLGTSPLYWGLARTLTLDMPVAMLLTATLLCFLLGIESRERSARAILLLAAYAAAALAVLTKGLIGVVLPVMVIGAWIVILNEWRTLRTIHLPAGIALFVLIAAPWHVLVARTNPEFFDFYFIHEHFLRYTTEVHRRDRPLWFFVPILLVGVLPWTAFLVQSLRQAWPRWTQRREHRATVFLLIWALLVFLFFSASGSKIATYILPVLPPLALLIGHYLDRMLGSDAFVSRRDGMILAVLTGGIAVSLALLPALLPASKSATLGMAKLGGWLPALAALFAAGTITAGIAAWRMNRRMLFASALATAVAVGLAIAAMLPRLDTGRSVRDLGMLLKPRLTPDAEVISYRDYFQDLPVYLGRRVTIARWSGELAFGMRQEDTRAWMIDDAEVWRRWQTPGQVYMLASRENYERLRADRPHALHLLADNGVTVLLTNHDVSR